MALPKTDYNEMADRGDTLPPEPARAEPARANTQPGERVNTSSSVQQDNPIPERLRAKTQGKPVEATIKGKGKRKPDPEPVEDGYVQRSLIAHASTFEKIRVFAFQQNRPAQELYREGLLRMMRHYGISEGINLDEV